MGWSATARLGSRRKLQRFRHLLATTVLLLPDSVKRAFRRTFTELPGESGAGHERASWRVLRQAEGKAPPVPQASSGLCGRPRVRLRGWPSGAGAGACAICSTGSSWRSRREPSPTWRRGEGRPTSRAPATTRRRKATPERGAGRRRGGGTRGIGEAVSRRRGGGLATSGRPSRDAGEGSRDVGVGVIRRPGPSGSAPQASVESSSSGAAFLGDAPFGCRIPRRTAP